MAFYDEMQGIARELLASELGQSGIFLISVTPGAGSIDDPAPDTESRHKLDGAARGASFKYVKTGLAQASDTQVTFSVIPGLPVVKGRDFVEVNGQRFKIVEVIRKPQTGTPVVFTVIARR